MKRPEQSFQLKHSVSSSAGQATMEYILILVVTVSLMLALTSQFFTPLRTFVNAYMGDYIACLLDSGELPSLGGESGLQDNSDECNARFEPASLARGRPPLGGEGGTGGARGRDGRGGSEDGSQSSGGGGYAGSSGRRASNLRGPPPRTGSIDRSSEPEVVEISLGNTPEGGFTRRSGSSAFADSTSGGPRAPTITYGFTGAEKEEIEAKKKAENRVVASDLAGPSPKKIPIKPERRTTASEDIEIEQWSIGDYLRFILIAAILIVLFGLIGSQVARLMKSWEK